MIPVADILLVIQCVMTLYMLGVITMVQVVNYPLFSAIGSDHFVSYHHQHVTRISFVVGIPMIAEAFSAALLLYFSPINVPKVLIWVNFMLVFFIWLVTLLYSIPAHHQLSTSFKQESHQMLLKTNGLRVFAWFFHAGVLAYIVCARFFLV